MEKQIMREDHSYTALLGALIWAAAVIMRRFLAQETGLIRMLLIVTPKFGIVWLIVGLTVTFWPYVFKDEFLSSQMYLLIGGVLLPVLMYEICYPILRGVAIYPWDIVASVAAAGCLAAKRYFEQRRGAP